MNEILQQIEVRKAQFAELPFFKFLEQGTQIEDAGIFVPRVAFFVLSFQDILRMNEEHVTDPMLVPIIKHHRQGDLGHDAWFLHDAHQLGVACDAAMLFGERCVETRNTAFAIASEIFRASDDRIRLAVPLAVEATADVVFSRVYKYFARTSYQGRLKYFSEEHFQAEQAHELFDEEIHNQVLSIQMTDALNQEAADVVDRIFVALTKMVCSVYQQIEQSQRERNQMEAALGESSDSSELLAVI